MKKLLVLALAFVLVMSLACAAVAETRSYMMVGAADAEGNVLASVTDDFAQVLDAEGNDITENWPILVFQCDDEAMTGAFGTMDEVAACTLELAEETDGVLPMTATFEDGSAMVLYYNAENDAFAFTDANGIIYTMIGVEFE